MKSYYNAFVLGSVMCCLTPVNSFTTPMTCARTTFMDTFETARYPIHLSVSTTEQQAAKAKTSADPAKETDDEPSLSELDARVLKSMLSENKLDLEQEDNMRKLLERGVAPKTPDKPEEADDDDDDKFASQMFKKLSKTVLWKKVKAKAGEVLESAAIFVVNRIERDAKLLSAVGVFAWDRAKRDVARALPQSGTSGGAAVGQAMRKATRQLTDKSSFEQDVQPNIEDLDLYEELNTPMDEIKSVTTSILEILSGQDISGTRRLRTVAPAGQANNAERQRRAYTMKKKTVISHEKEGMDKKLGRAAGGVVDAAWEIKREMEVETNRPGYRTETARKSLQAGAEKTVQVLKEAKEEPGGWRRLLFGESKSEKAAKAAAQLRLATTSVMPVSDELLHEKNHILSRLDRCLEAPDETWLVPDILSGCVVDEDGCVIEIDDNELREVITAMICLRDDLEELDMGEMEAAEVIDELKRIKGSIDTITSLATISAGGNAGSRVCDQLYGRDQSDDDEVPLLLRLDEFGQREPVAAAETAASFDSVYASTLPTEKTAKRNGMFFAEVEANGFENGASQEIAVVVPEVLDAEVNGNAFDPTSYVESSGVEIVESNGVLGSESLETLSVELVSDDDVEEAFGSAKEASVLSDDDAADENQEEETPGLVVSATLRTLDVAAFVVEKAVTVVPQVFKAGKTASSRLAGVSRDGLGYRGWRRHRNFNDGKQRY